MVAWKRQPLRDLPNLSQIARKEVIYGKVDDLWAIMLLNMVKLDSFIDIYKQIYIFEMKLSILRIAFNKKKKEETKLLSNL